MPRGPRQIDETAIYHIICRSIPEILLFRDEEDKDYYLVLLKKNKDKYKCSIYDYCLMDNHVHILFDPNGYNLSRFMKSINIAYVKYYNKKYKRYGPVFHGRFVSRIIKDAEDSLTVSAYINNNPKDMEGYCGREEKYAYSSYGIQLGIRKDYLDLVDSKYLMKLFGLKKEKDFQKRYKEIVSYHRDSGNIGNKARELQLNFEYEYRSYRNVILRTFQPAKVISFISDKLMMGEGSLNLKSKQKVLKFRALCAYSIRVLCGKSIKEICESIHNMTLSGCSKLCSKGYDLVASDNRYAGIYQELVKLGV